VRHGDTHRLLQPCEDGERSFERALPEEQVEGRVLLLRPVHPVAVRLITNDVGTTTSPQSAHQHYSNNIIHHNITTLQHHTTSQNKEKRRKAWLSKNGKEKEEGTMDIWYMSVSSGFTMGLVGTPLSVFMSRIKKKIFFTKK